MELLLKRLRESVLLLKRDAIKLLDYAQSILPLTSLSEIQTRLLDAQKLSRRVLSQDHMLALKDQLGDILSTLKAKLVVDSDKMDGNDVNNEHQYQSSKTDSFESEPSHENGEEAEVTRLSPAPKGERESQKEPNQLPLAVVLKAVPDILPYADGEVRSWHDFVRAAEFIRAMMGVSPDAWDSAVQVMGIQTASITLACMLQRISEINSPSGYLRVLTQKAAEGAFSSGPMVMALLNGNSRAA